MLDGFRDGGLGAGAPDYWNCCLMNDLVVDLG